jgi:iron(III) transport system permease protein
VTRGGLKRTSIWWDVILTIPYALPGTVLSITLIQAFNVPTVFSGNAVMVGTFWILPLAYLIRGYPLMMRSVKSSLEQLDSGIEEAAATLGAAPFERFRTIVLPSITPGIVAGAELVLVTLLGEFVASILLYTYATRPIAVEILAQVRAYNLGSAAAYSVLLLVLIASVVGLAEWFERKSV